MHRCLEGVLPGNVPWPHISLIIHNRSSFLHRYQNHAHSHTRTQHPKQPFITAQKFLPNHHYINCTPLQHLHNTCTLILPHHYQPLVIGNTAQHRFVVRDRCIRARTAVYCRQPCAPVHCWYVCGSAPFQCHYEYFIVFLENVIFQPLHFFWNCSF